MSDQPAITMPASTVSQTPASGIRVAMMLVQRELVRFARQPSRVLATVGTPAMFWALFAAGFADSFAPAKDASVGSYAAFITPGIMSLVAVFASIFAAISIIEDRNEGWLQAVLISPAPRWSIALGKLFGTTLPAWIQTLLILAMTPLAGAWPGFLSAVLVAALLLVVSLAVGSVGLLFAWRCESIQSFHAVMNLVFLPMWMLSGAFFDPGSSSLWLKWITLLNPLTWCHHAIRSVMVNESNPLAIMLTIAFAVVSMTVCIGVLSRASAR